MKYQNLSFFVTCAEFVARTISSSAIGLSARPLTHAA
jgi:hypothetical protein